MHGIVCLAFLALPISAAIAVEGKEFFGTVLSARGEAYVSRGFLEFDIKIEDELQFEDEIETGEDGRVQLSFKSSFLSVGPNTCFSISKEEDEGIVITLIDLECGEIRSKILDLETDERYKVDSINGSILVTGTDFVTGVNPDDDALSVSVLHGGVKVSGDEGGAGSGEKTVSTMQSLSGVGVKASAPASMSENDVMGIKNRLPLPGDGGGKSEAVDPPVLSEFMPSSFVSVIKSQVQQEQQQGDGNDSSVGTTGTDDSSDGGGTGADTGTDDAQVIDDISNDITTGQVTDDTKDDIATDKIVRRLTAPSFLPPPSSD